MTTVKGPWHVENLSFKGMNKLNNIFMFEWSMKFYFICHFDFLMLLYQKSFWDNFTSVNQFAIFNEFIALCETTFSKEFSSAICGLKIQSLLKFCGKEFYFRWLENSVIEIEKAAYNPLIFNHLNWNLSEWNLTPSVSSLISNGISTLGWLIVSSL